MTEPKFTPGPWQRSGVRALSPEYKGHGVGPDGDDYVVVVPYNPKDHFECLANACLIAAAPDMYEALESVREEIAAMFIRLGGGPEYSTAVKTIDAALVKARGDQYKACRDCGSINP